MGRNNRTRTRFGWSLVAATILLAGSLSACAPSDPPSGNPVDADRGVPAAGTGWGETEEGSTADVEPVAAVVGAGKHEEERAARILAALFPGGFASLDGSGNNRNHPSWGRVGRPYSRVAEPRYADAIGIMADGPSPRLISNRIFNDLGQNVFSENGVSQWGFAWGQFLDHTFGLRETGGKDSPMPFDPADPLESFTNDLGAIAFERSAAAAGTGVDSPREQVNTVSSYIDAWAVYGGSADRLEWLREGSLDGDVKNNDAHLLISTTGYLPRVDARGDPSAAPQMELMGRLFGDPERAVVAGDVRANENIVLTSVHTLFAREHNRIVDALPDRLPEQAKFQIARRMVMAEIQYVTYNEFLPALGIKLRRYRGYDPSVDATLSNEFAVVGYRAHSMIHGEIEAEAEASHYSLEDLEALEAQGVEIAGQGEEELEFAIPLNVAFGNPDLLEAIGLEQVLAGLGAERQYRNDEMIDNQLRSVLFQLPGPDTPVPNDCMDGPPLPECFQTVLDLGAVDIQRGRDHGMPTYNELRVAYGLRPMRSFAAITGEDTEEFPAELAPDSAGQANDPEIMDFVTVQDADGNELEPGSDEADESTVVAVRRTTAAARLKAIYGDVDRVEAFVGMLTEEHVPGTEFGELQLAIWTRQFAALRDGDRFFYLNDRSLFNIERRFGLDYRLTLSEIILLNTDIEPDQISTDVFKIEP